MDKKWHKLEELLRQGERSRVMQALKEQGRGRLNASDRLQAAHVGHENINDHQIERRIVEGGEIARHRRDPKTVPLEPSARQICGSSSATSRRRIRLFRRVPCVRFTLTLIAL